MKKTMIALVCMLMAAGTAMAQKNFTIGPKVGVDYTHWWGENINDESALSYQAGIFMEYRFSSKFAIAPEVVFAAHNRPKMEWQSWWLDEYLTRDITTTYHTNYINIPVMFKYYATSSLSIDLGPQFGFKVYDKSTDKWEDSNGYWEEKHNMGHRSFDFGLGLGATYNFNEKVFVQLRYTLGLIPLYKDGNARNGNAQLAFGYRF